MSDLTANLGISRQAVHKHLRKMIRNGEVLRSGTTRGAAYRLAKAGKIPTGSRLKRTYKIAGLQEDRVFDECSLWLNLPKQMNPASFEIIKYAFSEMLNNAIDHSNSEKCVVEWSVNEFEVLFTIRDFGIGLFRSIQTKLEFSTESEALGELIKGKTTTMKERHSGEGIFFTSRTGDLITFDSHKIELVFNTLERDVVVKERRSLKGTLVHFQISKNSRRNLGDIFSEFAPEQYQYRFGKTRVRVELLETDFVSRSEARRLLRGLDQFQEVILDFQKVKSIGQAFADEIFRVFPAAHPSITLRVENTSPVVDIMIQHVQNQNSGLSLKSKIGAQNEKRRARF